MYSEKPLHEYCKMLASGAPIPGGGSASAVVGAAGAALLAKVANFTIGKEKYKDFENEMASILGRSEALRETFTKLCSEDAVAYKKLSEAFKISKDDKIGGDKIQKALKEATRAPFEICKASHEAIKLCLPAAGKGNKNLITDACIGGLMLKCAFESSVLNIEINLKGINDNEFVANMKKLLRPMKKEVDAADREVRRLVETHLEGRG